MTTLYFIPAKAGKAFRAPIPANGGSQDTTMMDVAVVDTAGLVGYVEACLGIHCSEEAFNVRLCRYYKLLRRWLDAHEGNVLCNSFRLAHLSTARQLLVWRDELKMAQWDFRWIFNSGTSGNGIRSGCLPDANPSPPPYMRAAEKSSVCR